MARILLLTQVLPYPPDSGPKVKTWNVLKYLAARHDVTLASFVRSEDEALQAQGLARRGLCRTVRTVPMRRSPLFDLGFLGLSLLTGRSFTILRDHRPAMRRLLADLIAHERFDVVHADQLYMAAYALRLPGLKRLLDTHNAMYVLTRRLAETTSPPAKWLWAFDWPRLKRYEARACCRFDAVTAVSEEDRDALWRAMKTLDAPEREIPIIPIAIDTEETRLILRRPSGPNLVHVGTMYWPPNVDGILWFCREVYPLIRRVLPEVCFTIIGKNPPESVRALTADASIRVTGYVADLRPYLQDSAAMVVPVRSGGGMRVKILEALAWGLPMVSTTIGVEGIAVGDGQEVLIADKPQAYAAAVVRLLADGELSARLVEHGRRLVVQRYDYRQACRPLDAIYERLLKEAGSRK